MAIKLTASQKDEIRRLTQQANRTLRSYMKVYESVGDKVIPKEVTGGFDLQTRKQWLTSKLPLSRSVKFETEQEYKSHLRKLQRFDKDYGGADKVESMSDYTKVQRNKIFLAIETAGVTIDDQTRKDINKMNLVQIRQFWKDYTRRSIRKGLQYSSEAVMLENFYEYGPVEAAEVVSKATKGG